jgi:pimeloyl-ACP methyl ester carboxylesterase
VAWVEGADGVELWWEERGEGPALLVAHSYIQHPLVLKELIDDLASDHRVVRYDARGAGKSAHVGPYGMATDVADLLAVAEAAGPLVAIVANGDATNRAVHGAAQRPELVPLVISMETVPLPAGAAEDTDALVGSENVLDALVGMMRADYRSGMTAAIQRGNPGMSPDQIRERVDATVAYVSHDAGLARLDSWIRDAPADDARAVGDRLVIAFEGAGAWFPAQLLEHARQFLPDARFERLEAGAISRPDLTAAVVRRVTAPAGRPAPP